MDTGDAAILAVTHPENKGGGPGVGGGGSMENIMTLSEHHEKTDGSLKIERREKNEKNEKNEKMEKKGKKGELRGERDRVGTVDRTDRPLTERPKCRSELSHSVLHSVSHSASHRVSHSVSHRVSHSVSRSDEYDEGDDGNMIIQF